MSKYNDAAKRVMAKNSIVVNDLYTYAQQRLPHIQLPANVHFTTEGSAALAKQNYAVIAPLLDTSP